MDTPVVLANIPVQFRFLAKRGLFQIPLLGTHLTRAGHIPVPRDDARAAVKTMTTAAQAIRERGISLLIFPEGGRSQTGELAAFKEGAAYIAIRAGVPLVPIALKGTREILPYGSGHVRSGSVTMRIGDPIPTDQSNCAIEGASQRSCASASLACSTSSRYTFRLLTIWRWLLASDPGHCGV